MTFQPPRHVNYALTCLRLPLCQPLWNEVANITQGPYELGIAGGLAAMSAVCQDLIDVVRPGGLVGSVAVAVLAIADSGERKSTGERMHFSPIRMFEQRSREGFAEEHQIYKDKLTLWELRRSALVREIKGLMRQGDDVSHAEAYLLDYMRTKPAPPSQLRLLYEDATVSALLLGMHKSSQSACLVSSEGGSILNGSAFRDIAKINALLSGDDVIVDRSASESFLVSNRRLTLSIQLQPSAVKKFLEKRGEEARGSGFLARCLVFSPISTQGTRFLNSDTVSSEHYAPYVERMNQLLERVAMAAHIEGFQREVIKFSPEASARWLEHYNNIEADMAPGRYYAAARDHASKLAENIARVAAILHYFEGFEGDISPDTLSAAYQICNVASQHFMREFVPPPQVMVDAKMLNEWLDYRCRRHNQRYIQRSIIRQFGPGPLRDSSRLNSALMELQDTGFISLFPDGKTMMIDVFPHLRVT